MAASDTPTLHIEIMADKKLKKTASVTVFRGRDFIISVTNNHHANHHTKLHKFVHESGVAGSPIDDQKQKPEVAAMSQQKRQTIVKIRKDALLGRYTYKAAVDNVDIDPEIVVADAP